MITPTRVPSVNINDISNRAAIRIGFFFGIGVLFLAVVSFLISFIAMGLVLKITGAHL